MGIAVVDAWRRGPRSSVHSPQSDQASKSAPQRRKRKATSAPPQGAMRQRPKLSKGQLGEGPRRATMVAGSSTAAHAPPQHHVTSRVCRCNWQNPSVEASFVHLEAGGQRAAPDNSSRIALEKWQNPLVGACRTARGGSSGTTQCKWQNPPAQGSRRSESQRHWQNPPVKGGSASQRTPTRGGLHNSQGRPAKKCRSSQRTASRAGLHDWQKPPAEAGRETQLNLDSPAGKGSQGNVTWMRPPC